MSLGVNRLNLISSKWAQILLDWNLARAKQEENFYFVSFRFLMSAVHLRNLIDLLS